MAKALSRYWFDTEFMEDGTFIELLSIGVVCEDGREFYAENVDADLSHASEWVQKNVIPHLQRGIALMPRLRLADELRAFIDHAPPSEIWAYYGDYDWVVLCQLYGRMVDIPKGWPMFAMDVKQFAVSLGNPQLPTKSGTEHHALADARWTHEAWQYLMSRTEQ